MAATVQAEQTRVWIPLAVGAARVNPAMTRWPVWVQVTVAMVSPYLLLGRPYTMVAVAAEPRTVVGQH